MKVKLISVLLILVAGITVALMTINSAEQKEREYNVYLESARTNAKNEVPYTAFQKYRKAFSIKCDDEKIYQEYLEQAKILGETFYETAAKEYMNYFPSSPTAYEELCEFLYKTESYKGVISTANTARELGLATEKIKERYLECFYMLKYVKSGFEEATSFLGNYAMVKRNGLYGYITYTGSYLINPVYQDAKPFLGDNTAVNDGTEWYMINTYGYKIARPLKKVDDLSFISNGKILVSYNGTVGYINSEFNIPKSLPYEQATNFKNGIAAVKKKNKWALIDVEEGFITGFDFDEVVTDEFNTCINNGVIFVKKDDLYYMINKEGERITKQGFEDVYPFVGSESAAVCIDGKWGFVNAEGEIVIKPQYKKAKSFSIGLAPVSVNGTDWFYINSKGEQRVAKQFEDCLPFALNGIAAVKENGCWNYIKLLAYDN